MKNRKKNQKLTIEAFLKIADKYTKKIIGKKYDSIMTEFNNIQYLQVNSDFILVSSNCGNKLHIYDNQSFNLEYCIFLGDFYYDISSIDFDPKLKFLSLGSNLVKFPHAFCKKVAQ